VGVDLLDRLPTEGANTVAPVPFGGFVLDLPDHVSDALSDLLRREMSPAR